MGRVALLVRKRENSKYFTAALQRFSRLRDALHEMLRLCRPCVVTAAASYKLYSSARLGNNISVQPPAAELPKHNEMVN